MISKGTNAERPEMNDMLLVILQELDKVLEILIGLLKQ